MLENPSENSLTRSRCRWLPKFNKFFFAHKCISHSIHIPATLVLNQPPRSTQPGHPSTSRCNEWGANRHAARYTSPISVASQCKLMSGWGL